MVVAVADEERSVSVHKKIGAPLFDEPDEYLSQRSPGRSRRLAMRVCDYGSRLAALRKNHLRLQVAHLHGAAARLIHPSHQSLYDRAFARSIRS